MKPQRLHLVLGMLGAVLLAGCASWLPVGRQQTVSPWDSYDAVKAAFDQIRPRETDLDALHALGFDPARTPNVNILNYSQVVKTVVPGSTASASELPPGIRDCLQAEARCIGYALEEKRLERKRVGNFFADFLNFRRETHITGWSFVALIAVVDGTVTYKQWSGQPLIRQIDKSRNPLGPLQEAGGHSRDLLLR